MCEYNTDYLHEKQLMVLEQRISDVIVGAKSAGLSCDEFVEMVRALYEEKGL